MVFGPLADRFGKRQILNFAMFFFTFAAALTVSMAIGGSVAFFLSWRGIFAAYSALAALVTVLFFTVGRKIPSDKNPDSEFLAPYARLLGNAPSLILYLIVLLEGIFIVGSFSYLGAFIENLYQYNYLTIGFIMTAFGIMAVIGGRMALFILIFLAGVLIKCETGSGPAPQQVKVK
ncbi:major facilitator superfamily protein [Thermincola ferriacetica]|uniref:Major facilitator superfamily protein n=1 Tax=Thermincola ferriacetica TaxID=281456 RepID=A0A0L6W120_9FIRM|nr:MFS transporter [Thermincola ferriacetica]KNZ69166.1 major facilitator superfamily protein [Thermincola ferriacetica]